MYIIPKRLKFDVLLNWLNISILKYQLLFSYWLKTSKFGGHLVLTSIFGHLAKKDLLVTGRFVFSILEIGKKKNSQLLPQNASGTLSESVFQNLN